MTIYCRCLSGKKEEKKSDKAEKKLFKLACIDVYLLFDQLPTWYWFYCRLSGGRHREDTTATCGLKKKKNREKEEKQSVVGWFVFVSSPCRVSVCSVDWGSSWVQVQITWRRIGPAFTLPAPCSTLKASKHSSDSRPPVLNTPLPPLSQPTCQATCCEFVWGFGGTRFSPLSWFLPVTSVRFSAVAQQQQQQERERKRFFFCFGTIFSAGTVAWPVRLVLYKRVALVACFWPNSPWCVLLGPRCSGVECVLLLTWYCEWTRLCPLLTQSLALHYRRSHLYYALLFYFFFTPISGFTTGVDSLKLPPIYYSTDDLLKKKFFMVAYL